MSQQAAPAPAKAGRKSKPKTEQQKKIIALQKLKSDNKATEQQITELENLKASQSILDLKRLAAYRVTKIINSLHGIGNLSRYKPSEKQTSQVFTAIKDAVDAAHTKWQGNQQKEAEDFSLTD